MAGFGLDAAAAALVVQLAAFGGPPWVLNQSPGGISLRWYPDTTPSALADQAAAAHCAAFGRNAALIDSEEDGSAELAHYACR
jgi:hypothetical protein